MGDTTNQGQEKNAGQDAGNEKFAQGQGGQEAGGKEGWQDQQQAGGAGKPDYQGGEKAGGEKPGSDEGGKGDPYAGEKRSYEADSGGDVERENDEPAEGGRKEGIEGSQKPA